MVFGARFTSRRLIGNGREYLLDAAELDRINDLAAGDDQ
jgi:hypothetical protein